MEKLLVICGPTATGKTSLALSVAKNFNGELVSTDSRQVYKGMDIGTGKDLPVNSKFEYRNPKIGGSYEIEGVKVWGLDVVDPREEFSVSKYVEIARGVIRDIWKRGKLPILVGGTGFYIKGVVDGIATMEIPKDEEWRREAESLTREELYKRLKEVDKKRARSMNESDRKNAARLVRAIEVGKWWKDRGNMNIKGDKGMVEAAPALFIGLTTSREVLNKRIEKRVEKRVEQGIIGEIRKLLKAGVTWENQSMKSLGYREWRPYFAKVTQGEERIMKDEVIEKWKQDEKNYAKRQMTWFKKDKRMHWFDIDDSKYPENVLNLVEMWNT